MRTIAAPAGAACCCAVALAVRKKSSAKLLAIRASAWQPVYKLATRLERFALMHSSHRQLRGQVRHCVLKGHGFSRAASPLLFDCHHERALAREGSVFRAPSPGVTLSGALARFFFDPR